MMATCICGRKEIAGLGRSHLCPHPDGPKWSVRQGVPKANVSAETLSASQKSRLRYETKRSTPVLDLTETEGHHQMTLVGYARVSSTDQDLEIQLAVLKAAGCKKVFAEKVSGTSRQGREELEKALDWVREGDTLVITRIDRLGRSVLDLQLIVKQLQDKGVHLKATEQPINTGDAAGKAFLGMLQVFAEFETNLRRERQLEGIARARAEGAYKGRPAKLAEKHSAEVQRLKAEGVGPAAIAKQLGIGRASVYRLLGAS